MTGLLYKECKQNRIFLLLTALAPLLTIILPLLLYATAGDYLDEGVSLFEFFVKMRFVVIALSYICVSMMQSNTFMGDDTKRWGYFTASNPKGIKGYIYTKYVLIFAMCGLMLISSYFFDALFSNVVYAVTKQETAMLTEIFIILFYLQLLLSAVDLPFLVRFGVKLGSMIKMIVFILLVIVFAFLLLLNPGAIMDSLFDVIYKILNGEATDTVALIVGVFPFLALGGYYLSYRISCRIYMKGVEQYDK